MSFSKEWERRCAARRAIEELPEVIPVARYDEPVSSNQDQIEAPLFMVFKRTVTGKSKALYVGLLRAEAEAKYTSLNNKEAEKRVGTVLEADQVVLFDIVEQGKPEQLSPYFNHRPTLITQPI